jgi:hypothetical protein
MARDPISELRDSVLRAGACASHPPLARSRSIEEAALWAETVQKCPQDRRIDHLRWLARNDLFFLLVHLLNAKFLEHQWYFDRCAEVQQDPDCHLDFWSRGGGKSTIITYGKTIQDILIDPEVTFGIFSHTRPIAKQFLRQIKSEFEKNELLYQLFPEILYEQPKLEAPKWAEDDGLIVKRKGNPKESTVEAWGLTDGQPTSKHFSHLIYDDVIEERAVTGPDMIDKVTKMWEQSLNLSATDPIKFRVAGTFYDEGDTYHVMMERKFGTVRKRPIVANGLSLLLSEEGLSKKKQAMSPRTFAMQILLDPTEATKEAGFRVEWLQRYKTIPNIRSLNKYIVVDPAGDSIKTDSQCAMWVIGLNFDKRKYVLDGALDKMNLSERGDHLFRLIREYDSVLKVGYEKFAMQADVDYLKERMDRENFRFTIIPLGSNQMKKDNKIYERLVPEFRGGLILLPENGIKFTQKSGKQIDLIEYFIEKEYTPFPFTRYKDGLDSMALLKDPELNIVYPRGYGQGEGGRKFGDNDFGDGGGSSWLSE